MDERLRIVMNWATTLFVVYLLVLILLVRVTDITIPGGSIFLLGMNENFLFLPPGIYVLWQIIQYIVWGKMRFLPWNRD